MNNSREFLRQLPVAERIKLAKQLDVTPDFLYQIGSGFRNPSRDLAIRLEILTAGKFKEADFDEEIRANLIVA